MLAALDLQWNVRLVFLKRPERMAVELWQRISGEGGGRLLDRETLGFVVSQYD